MEGSGISLLSQLFVFTDFFTLNMERRHEYPIIARISGKYRSLVVIRYQLLHSVNNFGQCPDTLKILQAVSNRIPIEEEL